MLLTTVLLNIFLLTGSFSRAEPVCSKFHYEERTLEKMIRQEILVEKMKADLEDTKLKVLDIERKTNDKIEVLKENMKEAQGLVKLQTETNIKDYNAEMEYIRESMVTPVIAFKAHMVSDKTLSDNIVIAFTENLLDTENAYNNQTGIYSAPVSGIYYFSVQICLLDRSFSYYSISLNDVGISGALLGGDWTKCYTMDALTSVGKGDKVSVKCADSCSGDKLWENNYARSSFSGVLLHKQR